MSEVNDDECFPVGAAIRRTMEAEDQIVFHGRTDENVAAYIEAQNAALAAIHAERHRQPPTLSPTASASVLRAAAEAGVPVEAPPRSSAEFDRLWTAARITAPDSEVDDEMWLAREQLKVYILAHGLTGGWLEDIVFGPAVTLVRTATPVRDAPRRRRR